MTAIDDERRREERAQLRRLERVSIVEACTLLVLLCVAVPLKHLAGWDPAVRLMGPVHGLVFVGYAWTVLQTVAGGGWSGGGTARLIAGAFVPFGGFLNRRWLARRAAALA